jgi:hypothetical protein
MIRPETPSIYCLHVAFFLLERFVSRHSVESKRPESQQCRINRRPEDSVKRGVRDDVGVRAGSIR